MLADLSRHLDYFEVSRSDEAPTRPLGPSDHIIIGCRDADARLKEVKGQPGFSALVPELAGQSAGARAIVLGAALVQACLTPTKAQ